MFTIEAKINILELTKRKIIALKRLFRDITLDFSKG
jgi:hypothetical protein